MKAPRIFAALLVMGATLTPLGQAQNPSPYSLKIQLPECDGNYAVVHLIEIGPGSNVDQYLQELDKHKDWFKEHGYTDRIFASRVLERDPKTGKSHFSNHMILTYHFIQRGNKPPVHDAEWDAYVKQYLSKSSLKETHVTCFPMRHISTPMK